MQEIWLTSRLKDCAQSLLVLQNEHIQGLNIIYNKKKCCKQKAKAN